MDRFQIQTKVDGKWSTHDVIEAPEADAREIWDYVRGTLTDPARLVQHDSKGRVHVKARQQKRAGFRVVYGETMPVWSRVLPSRAAAEEFAAKKRNVGDIVFSIEATR